MLSLPFLKRLLAVWLAAALIFLSPGLGCYRALAQNISIRGGVQVNPASGGTGTAGTVTRISPTLENFSSLTSPLHLGLCRYAALSRNDMEDRQAL